jgi:hypothetical protein
LALAPLCRSALLAAIVVVLASCPIQIVGLVVLPFDLVVSGVNVVRVVGEPTLGRIEAANALASVPAAALNPSLDGAFETRPAHDVIESKCPVKLDTRYQLLRR